MFWAIFDLFLLLFGANFKCMCQQNMVSERRLGHHAHMRPHGWAQGRLWGQCLQTPCHQARPGCPAAPSDLAARAPFSALCARVPAIVIRSLAELEAHSPQVSCSIPPFDQRGTGGGGSERGHPQRGQGRVLQQCDGHLRELRRRESFTGDTGRGWSRGGDTEAVADSCWYLTSFRAPPAPPPSPTRDSWL